MVAEVLTREYVPASLRRPSGQTPTSSQAEFQTHGLFRYPVAYGARDVPQTKSLIHLPRADRRHPPPPPPNRGAGWRLLPPQRPGRSSAIPIDRIRRSDVESCL